MALAEIPPFAFNALRFPLAVTLLVLAWALQRRPGSSPTDDLRALAAIGVLGYVGYQMFFVSGIARMTASNLALVLATVPAFVAAINGVRWTETLGWQAWLGVLLSIAGIALLIRGGGGTVVIGGQTLAGDLLVVGAAICSVYRTFAL